MTKPPRPPRFANAVLLLAMGVGLIVLAFVLFHHERLLTGGLRNLFFLGAPLGGLAVLAACFRLSPENRTAAAITLLSVGVALFGFEYYLTFVKERTAVTQAPPGIAFDTRTKFQVVLDQRQKGTAAFPSVFPAYLMQTQADGHLRSPLTLDGGEVLPLGGGASVPTVLCNESGSYVTIDAGPLGFANPAAAWNAPERPRIALVGDSFVQGYCVPQEQTFASLIRARHPATVNLGSSGSGPLIELASLLDFLPAHEPDVTVWFFFEGNDIPGNLSIEKRSPLLRRYLEEEGFTQNLRNRHEAVDKALKAHVEGLIRERPAAKGTDAGTLQTAISFIGLSKIRGLLKMPSAMGPPDYPLFERILGKAKRAVDGWGGTLVLAYLPDFSSVAPEHERSPFADANYREVPAIAAHLEIPVIDLRKTIAAHPDPLSLYPFRQAGHFNPAGHALVAATVLDGLKSIPAP